MKTAYDDARALIAKLEHFSVGVNSKIYDFKTVDALGGMHLVYLYDKVEPIIKRAREYEKHSVPYIEFEILIKRIRKNHNITKG